MSQIGLDGPDDDGEAAAERIGPAGEEQAQRLGEAQHPLADRHLGKHMVDEMGRGLDHAPGAAGGAEPAAFAGECHEVLVLAAIALHAQEAVFEPAAAQIVLEFGEHKSWQRSFPLLQRIAQARQVLLDDRVERRVFRRVPLIACAGLAGLLDG